MYLALSITTNWIFNGGFAASFAIEPPLIIEAQAASQSIQQKLLDTWLGDAPPAYSRLIDRGQVTLVYDQVAIESAHRTALTVFEFSMKYRMRHRFKEMPSENAGKKTIEISVNFYRSECEVTHRILLANDYQPLKPWESALLQHEFDHVAISSDPRLIAMLTCLDSARQTWKVEVDESMKVTDGWLNLEIEMYVGRFREALVSLVQAYYDQLDEESRNGMIGLRDRITFFENLYSIEELKKSRFTYLPVVEKTLEKLPATTVSDHYRLR